MDDIRKAFDAKEILSSEIVISTKALPRNIRLLLRAAPIASKKYLEYLVKLKKAYEEKAPKKDVLLVFYAEMVQVDIKFLTFSDTDEILFYNSDKGIWQFGAERIIRQLCRSIDNTLSIHHLEEILDKIRTDTYQDRVIFERQNIIALKNGVFNIDTWCFNPHKAENYLLNYHYIEYQPNIFPHKFATFLSEILPEEQHNLLLEIMAYPFINDYRYNKAFLFYGEGNNGKTVLLNVMIAILGEQNIKGFSMQHLEQNQFAASELFGKLANICDDMSPTAMKTTSAFKVLTGNGYASHNVKRQETILFRNRAKMTFASNKLPIIYDNTIAIWRRLCLIAFEKIIPEESQDKDLIQKLTTAKELSGILNLLLISLKNLLARKGFHGLRSIKDEQEKYIKTTDIVHSLCKFVLETDINEYITFQELHTIQCRYAAKLGIEAVAKQTLTRDLQRWLPAAFPDRIKISNRRTNIWRGIKIKKDWKYLEEKGEKERAL